jgi:two-component system response regulator
MTKLRPILLVEDNPEDAELTRLAFEQNGVANPLILKRDGVEAFEYLFGNGTTAQEMTDLPQVVILDLKLPRVNGLEVLKQIRAAEATRYLPVVVLTSSNQDRDVIECYRLGVNAYVCKPVDFSAFSHALTQIGHFWLTIEHPADHQ